MPDLHDDFHDPDSVHQSTIFFFIIAVVIVFCMCGHMFDRDRELL